MTFSVIIKEENGESRKVYSFSTIDGAFACWRANNLMVGTENKYNACKQKAVVIDDDSQEEYTSQEDYINKKGLSND
jgi:hypothetical protein